MVAKPQRIVTELFEQAVDTFDAAVKAGVKLQEEAARWWSDVLSEAGSAQDWQRKMQSAMAEAIPTAQKNAEEGLRVLDQSTRSSLELLKRAFEAGQSESIAQAQAKAQELWEASLAAMRKNAQAMVQANARAMESWAHFARKNTDGRQTEPEPAMAH